MAWKHPFMKSSLRSRIPACHSSRTIAIFNIECQTVDGSCYTRRIITGDAKLCICAVQEWASRFDTSPEVRSYEPFPLSSNFTKLRVHSSRAHWLIQPCYHDVWIWLYFTCFWFTLSWVLKRGVSMYVEFRYLCRHTHASARRPDSEYL